MIGETKMYTVELTEDELFEISQALISHEFCLVRQLNETENKRHTKRKLDLIHKLAPRIDEIGGWAG